MFRSRKPMVAGVTALVALLILSAGGIAGTSWGPRSYTTFAFAAPGGGTMMLLSSPSQGVGMMGAAELGAADAPLVARNAAPNKVELCPAPCTGTQLAVNGSLMGLGNTNETADAVDMRVQTIAVITCTNQGGTEAPGRNVVFYLTDDEPINPDDISDNGRYYFGLSVGGDSSSSFQIGAIDGPAKDYGCPNNNWTASVKSYEFLCAKLTATVSGSTTSVVDKFSSKCTLT